MSLFFVVAIMPTGEIPIIRLSEETATRLTDHARTQSGRTFDEFCRDEHTQIVRALTWALGDTDLGRDAADEAFARALERWGKVSSMANPSGWVYRVGLNWGKRRIWRAKRGRELIATVPITTEHLDSYQDPDLAEALAALPHGTRSVIVMRHLLGFSELETAEALGIRPGTVKSRTNRGLSQLRVALSERTNE